MPRPAPQHSPKANTVAHPTPRKRAQAPAGPARDEWQPGPAQSGPASPQTVLSLQRRFGNRAVQGLIQPKPPAAAEPKAEAAGEPFERPADPLADGLIAPASPLAAESTPVAGRPTRGLLQLKRALVGAKTTARKFKGPRTDNQDNDVKAVEKSPKGAAFERLEDIDVFDGNQAHISDKTGFTAWYRIKSGKGAGEYIRGTKLMTGLTPGQAAPEQGAVKENDVSFLDAGNAGMSNIDNNLLDYTRQVSVQGGNTIKLNQAEGGTWAAAGLLGMAVSLRDLADDEKSAWDKVSAAIGLISGAVSVAGATAQIVGNTATQGTSLAQQANVTSAWLLSYGDMFSGLLNGIRLIKNVVELVKMVAGNERYATGKGVQLGGEILGAALDTARNVVRSIRLVNEAINNATVGTQFAQVVPGLDIAIAAVKSIPQGYYLVVSAIEMQRMYKRKKELEAELEDQGHTPEDIKATGKRHRTEEAQAATFAQLITRTDQKIAKTEAERAAIKLVGTEKERAQQGEKRVALSQRLDHLRAKKQQLERGQTELNTQINAGETGGGLTRSDLQERELASDTHIANKRRVTRQAVHIGTNLTQIAGSIAALVSGPGAPAAVAVKLAAAGVDASLPLFRWLKQKGRDMAARNTAKGESGVANKIFNSDKSTAAKQRARQKQAVLILQMVGRLSQHFPLDTDNDQARNVKTAQLRLQATRVEGYIRATGCPPERLYAKNGKIDEQIKVLVEELSKRELA